MLGLLLLHLLDGMLHVNVRNFVRHHAGKLRFAGSRGDCSDIDENRPARQSERVDLLLRNNVKLKGPRELLRNYRDKFFPQLLDVFCLGARIGQHRHLLVNLGHRLLTELLLLLLAHPGISRIRQLRSDAHRKSAQRYQRNPHSNRQMQK